MFLRDLAETTAEPTKPRKEDRRQGKRKLHPEVSEGQMSEGNSLLDKTLELREDMTSIK